MCWPTRCSPANRILNIFSIAAAGPWANGGAWLRPLTERYLKQFGSVGRPRHREVVAFLRTDKGLQRALAKCSDAMSAGERLNLSEHASRGGRGALGATGYGNSW